MLKTKIFVVHRAHKFSDDSEDLKLIGIYSSMFINPSADLTPMQVDCRTIYFFVV